jgi:hypothetical protein
MAEDTNPTPGTPTKSHHKNPDPDVKPTGEDKNDRPKEDLFVIVDKESGALEYGPAPDKDAAFTHAAKLRALDLRGSLADNVGRDVCVYQLKEVKEPKDNVHAFPRVATDRVDRWDRTSEANAGDDNVYTA